MKEQSERFKANVESLEKVRQFIATFMTQEGVAEEQIYNFELSADEHFANLIEHAFAKDVNRSAIVTCRADATLAQVIISDDSAGFDPRQFSIPDVEQLPIYEIPPGGFGNFFICELMDDVDYIHNPHIENKLILTVYRQHND